MAIVRTLAVVRFGHGFHAVHQAVMPSSVFHLPQPGVNLVGYCIAGDGSPARREAQSKLTATRPRPHKTWQYRPRKYVKFLIVGDSGLVRSVYRLQAFSSARTS